ncbi:MAG TPA: amino acid adenylation domain-containing protein [Ktedonobacteraceae bacterium]|nr:amino acid adenylation domain-containing protein [Ktedonobacteraceae bacterium]
MQKTAAYKSTPPQNGLLFNSLSSDEPGVDVIQVICRIPEALQVEAFLSAWRLVIARHEVLRAAFHWEGAEQPVQEIFAEIEVPFALEDWNGCPAEDCQARLEDFLRRDRQQQFTLWTPPLWRIALLRLTDHLYHCVFTFHHAILDGRSLPIVLNEVVASYRKIASGTPDALNVWSTVSSMHSYQEYASWWLQQDHRADEHFWKQTLADFETPVSLPEETSSIVARDRTTSRAVGIAHAEEDLVLPMALGQALRQLAKEHDLRLNTILQGAWALLVSAYCGHPDVVFGEIRSCRHNTIEGAEEMVGFFLNTLPARIRVDRSQALLPWLQGIRTFQRALREHQLTPLLQVQQWSQIPQGTPLFTSLFIFENRMLQSLLQTQEDGGLFTQATLRRKPSYPLVLYIFAEPEIATKFVYDPRRFSQETMQRLLTQLRHLLQQMVDHPHVTLADLSLLTETERQQVLVTWNNTAHPHDTHRLIHQQIEMLAARTPDALAIQAGERQFTYAQLNGRANQLAHMLQARSVGPETRVGICLARSPELILGQLGVLKAGGAFVSLDPDYPWERLDFLLQDAQISILLTSHDLLPKFSRQSLQLIALDTTADPLAVWSEQNPVCQVSSANIAYVIYTSGSTGRPKGVAIQHDSLANLVAWHQRVYVLRADDRTTQLASPSFDASIWEIWPTLAAGASLHFPEQETLLSPQVLVAWFALHAITVAFLPTPVGEAVLQEAWPQESALRALLVGGDRLQRRPDDTLPFGLYNHYGLTETTVVATWTRLFLDTLPTLVPPIGRPMDNMQTYVLDEYGCPVPVGVTGELYIGGTGLARGYLFRPDLTAERFLPHPWSTQPGMRLYRSGDLARYRSDGQIEFLGRRDQQVKLRGYRIELGEIEATLAQYPGVANALVLIAQAHPLAGEATADQMEHFLFAYIIPGPGTTLHLEEIRHFLSQRLPAYMLPTGMMLLDALPLTPNGKVDRRALPAPVLVSALPEAERPSTPLERTLIELWTQVLGQTLSASQVSAFNIHQSFFTLGGHSLLAAQVVLRINEELHLNLPINSIFNAPTIAQMAALIHKYNELYTEEVSAIPRLDRSRYHIPTKDETR